MPDLLGTEDVGGWRLPVIDLALCPQWVPRWVASDNSPQSVPASPAIECLVRRRGRSGLGSGEAMALRSGQVEATEISLLYHSSCQVDLPAIGWGSFAGSLQEKASRSISREQISRFSVRASRDRSSPRCSRRGRFCAPPWRRAGPRRSGSCRSLDTRRSRLPRGRRGRDSAAAPFRC